GHSLGEYDALFAAGCFDLATGVRLVQRRGELMGRSAGGGMVAVVDAQADEELRRSRVAGVDVANLNSPVQVVLSGPDDELRRAAETLRGAGARCVPL